MLIGVIFLGTISEALSCVFIFYCLDRKFDQLGYAATNQAPTPIRQIFEQVRVNSEYRGNIDHNNGQRQMEENNLHN